MADNAGTFRSRVKGFTVVQNNIAKDSRMSFKAKGMYLVIMANITNPNIKLTKKMLMNDLCCEGEKAFNGAWNELKEAGYLKVHLIPNGNQWTSEYELLEEPVEGAHTFYYNSKGEITMTNIDRAAQKAEKMDTDSGDEEPSKPTIVRQGKGVTSIKIAIPPLGSNANGSNANGNNANGSDANGGNNINPFLSTDNKTNSSTPSFIPRKGERRNEASEPVQTPIIVDPDRDILAGDVSDVMYELEKNLGIPVEMAFEPEMMKKTVMVLIDWNNRECDGKLNPLEKMVYAQIVECMTEMATALKPGNYKGAIVSYKNMIDMMNRFCDQEHGYEGAMVLFADEVKKRVVYSLRHNDVKDSKKYIKSIIWEQLSTYQMTLRASYM